MQGTADEPPLRAEETQAEDIDGPVGDADGDAGAGGENMGLAAVVKCG